MVGIIHYEPSSGKLYSSKLLISDLFKLKLENDDCSILFSKSKSYTNLVLRSYEGCDLLIDIASH